MKRIAIVILLLLTCKFGYGVNEELVQECQSIIIKVFDIHEFNPIHQPVTDSIQNRFQDIFRERDNSRLSNTYNQHIETAFSDIYKNGIGEYEDSDDIRRMKMRRASCFASIALLSDYDKAYTFLDYAKFSLHESHGKPEAELEDQYLGLLLMEIVFLIEEDYLSAGYVTAVEEYLLENKQKIATDILLDTTDFLKKCKSITK